MSEPEPIAPDAIAATNVRPAFEASLHFGATEAELEEHAGLTRALVESSTATVPGDATYRHMELMFGKPGYPRFVTSAAALHTARTLGVVGLAAKTASTVEAAMHCHHRFQHLTNRTARYESARKGGRFVLEEIRESDRQGALLISDYTMLVAMQLIRDAADGDATPQAMRSRRPSLPEAEREAYEQFIGAPVVTGAERSSLIFDESIADLPVASADPEPRRVLRRRPRSRRPLPRSRARRSTHRRSPPLDPQSLPPRHPHRHRNRRRAWSHPPNPAPPPHRPVHHLQRAPQHHPPTPRRSLPGRPHPLPRRNRLPPRLPRTSLLLPSLPPLDRHHPHRPPKCNFGDVVWNCTCGV